MIKGWKIIAIRPSTGGAASLQTWLLVAKPDRDQAVQAVKSRYPDADVKVDSEAEAEYLANYDVSPGEILVLVEGT